ncbi:carbohydrate ABC transporter permease [Bailinhaonella thermotolerans]|uniref:Carbohydrate ABC transporter permease n=2 Tax=Bailinhaonella thermotolerans TaxID=1070861 RepID=A0A3A4AEV6_9ACTN|nr:carbohydrate ABC transporter permease [Bailinhaonella thermotolerans]
MAVTAFKPGREMFAVPPRLLPANPTLANFGHVLSDGEFWRSAQNSLIVAACTVLAAMAFAFLASLALARFAFRGRRALLVALIVVQMVPHVALVIPIFLTLGPLRLTDALPGLVISYLAFALPFAIWTLRGFVAGVPRDLEEAAMVDGCTRMGAFRRVVLPLIFPGLVATSIYTLILAWNEYLLTYFLISSPEHYTLPLWLTHFITTEGTEYGPLMAGATLIATPVAVFFALVQRHLARGLTAGAVKG